MLMDHKGRMLVESVVSAARNSDLLRVGAGA